MPADTLAVSSFFSLLTLCGWCSLPAAVNNSMESECVRPGEGPSSTCKSMYYGSWAVGIGCMIAIFCCKENAKIVPRNYILLAVCTVSEGLMLGVISSFYNTSSVFIAAGLTLVVAFALILFSMQTK